VKANEFSKKGIFSTKYALGVTIAPDEERLPESEWQEATSIIKEWMSDRGKKVDFVMVTLLGNEQIRHELETLVKNTASIDPAFKGLKLELNFLDEHAKPINKMVLC
jgi:hypothetical protein